LNGVSTAVFPSEPERRVYNNALLDRDLGPIEGAAAADAMQEAYESAEVDRYAAWVHESDEGMRAELSSRGYTIAESTRAMGMSLDDICIPVPEIELGPPDWSQHLHYLRAVGAPDGLLAGVDPSGFHVLTGMLEGEIVATAIAYDHDRDVGIYNMGTLPHARRRGLGTALTSRHLLEAVERGCSTATIQSTPMAERVYAVVGFRDLGQFLEYVPGCAHDERSMPTDAQP
jgi:GNAT superfamily N-acetyltransferase